MKNFNILTRRSFLSAGLTVGMTSALSSLIDIPLVAKRALAADTTLGRNGKKLLFIFLRGANDSLNSVIPIMDPAYAASRPTIGIPQDPAVNYGLTGKSDFPVNTDPKAPTFSYANAIRLGNGFAALHPALKFLAPVYNAGDLALVHRVAYPRQSRSHFDSQNYWENGNPNNNVAKDGIFYRTILESGLASSAALTGVSFQNSLPLIFRGSKIALTNLTDPNNYSLLGIPNTGAGSGKADEFLRIGNSFPFPDKKNRNLLELQYKNMMDTLKIFADLDFSDAGTSFVDSAPTDGDSIAYHLFPTSNNKNGGYSAHLNDGINAGSKYVVPTGQYGFFDDLKSAAIVLNKTDAIITGTQLDGFDTHSNQGGATGQQANLHKSIAWAIYGLQKYFTQYGDKVHWKDLVVITLSEFGRTTEENSDAGTDHAEAGVMFVAGGAVKGYNKGNTSGVFGASPNDSKPWVPDKGGSMFRASQRYLERAIDYRSVLGKIIRDHLGASQDQLNRIIPGYAVKGESLQNGGISTKDGVNIMGEVPIV
jgi:uncharacterized protein (DUF1501 family)